MLNKVISFLQESKQELRRVNWPTLAETRRLTIVVIAISLAVSIFLGLLDAAILLGLEKALGF